MTAPIEEFVFKDDICRTRFPDCSPLHPVASEKSVSYILSIQRLTPNGSAGATLVLRYVRSTLHDQLLKLCLLYLALLSVLLL